ncbi:alpha/beta hydrolase [Candidatus Binatia bacterium]|jgi:pimeloyl-ACP methyl ester carboxylesterase|nr:alpha/beta hydrolase [Candidatus Binatia bacterium]
MVEEPRESFVEANRLRLHLLEWGRPGDRPPLLLLHGFQEHAHAWDWLAPLLARDGRHVVAWDARGHGDSEWIGRGGYYHFADYVADVAFVVRHLGGRVSIVGHSMGGNVTLLYTGTEPERVAAAAVIEGLGPVDTPMDAAPRRHAGWIADLERVARGERRDQTLDEAAAKLRRFFPLTEEISRHLAQHGTKPSGDDGRVVWKWDPLHATRSPQPFYVAQARTFWARIACPVLYLEGATSFLSTKFEIEDRLATLGAERVTIADAAHHPHLEQPEATARVLLDFFARAEARPR